MKNSIARYKLNPKILLPEWTVLILSILVSLGASASIYQIHQWADRSSDTIKSFPN